jgi:hypothetical protein
MNSRGLCQRDSLSVARVSALLRVDETEIPQTPGTASGCRKSWFRSVVRGHRPVGDSDGLGRLFYLCGSGLSWKPIAAAFRPSTFNMLALILASYSSIDWVTYSSPYLSIL